MSESSTHTVSQHSRSRSNSTGVSLETVLVVVAAVLVAAGGLLHLKIWNSDYRSLPSAAPGAWVVKYGFPVNTVIGLALAAVLLVGFRRRLAVLAALAFTVVCLGALVLSRTVGIFGWTETGWGSNPTQVAVVEAVGIVVLVAALVLPRVRHRA